MTKTVLTLIVAFLLLGAGLIWGAVEKGTSLVLLPSEVLNNGELTQKKRIRVAGRVTNDTIDYQVEPSFRLAFSIINPPDPEKEAPQSPGLPVVYEGIKPDMFAPGRDVIIDGDLRNGTLHAAKLLTQCPSKYEPPSATERSPEGKNEYSGSLTQ